ncbi:hypothetical protein COY07_06365 [Candidatus Peregrinibacteria bacterium CG_4_10_14_0_2_um_filter_43_11]|nr:MAG: hypothetical protein COY07_06365 [Candidatus Peregrinibacteria bacterium CG_4_10_14_0_2_um_filter_43_11]
MNDQIEKITQRIEAIETRNKKVEADKAWETSWARKILIAIITYLLIVIFMSIAGFKKPFLEAIVPATAYLISMSIIPQFKTWWIKKHFNNPS